MGNIGSSELLIILVLALLLLGPKRLPEVGESLGRTLRRFKQASRELRDEIESERDSIGLDRNLEEKKPVPPPPADTQPRGEARDPQAREETRDPQAREETREPQAREGTREPQP